MIAQEHDEGFVRQRRIDGASLHVHMGALLAQPFRQRLDLVLHRRVNLRRWRGEHDGNAVFFEARL
jgi:hypothetical protein